MLRAMEQRIWTVTIDGAEKTFPTLKGATGYLGRTFDGTQKEVSIESHLLDVEGRIRDLRRSDTK